VAVCTLSGTERRFGRADRAPDCSRMRVHIDAGASPRSAVGGQPWQGCGVTQCQHAPRRPGPERAVLVRHQRAEDPRLNRHHDPAHRSQRRVRNARGPPVASSTDAGLDAAPGPLRGIAHRPAVLAHPHPSQYRWRPFRSIGSRSPVSDAVNNDLHSPTRRPKRKGRNRRSGPLSRTGDDVGDLPNPRAEGVGFGEGPGQG
jgi:hypothetical protein